MHPILAFYVYLASVLHAYGDLCAMIHVLMLIIGPMLKKHMLRRFDDLWFVAFQNYYLYNSRYR